MKKFKGLFVLVLMALVLFLAVACDGTKIKLEFSKAEYTVEIGEELELTPIITNEKEEEFVLLYSSNEEEVAIYENGVVVGVSEGSTKVKVELEDNSKVYAEATINVIPKQTVVVKFDSDGGSTVSDVSVLVGEKLTKPTNPTKAGFVFVGWFKEAAKTNLYDFDAVVAGAMTLYAKWEVAEYDVVFEVNGGSAVDGVGINHGQKLAKPEDPEKDGYDFVGWYSDASLNTLYDFDAVVTGDLKLYAKWELATYKATLHTDGGIYAEGNAEKRLDLIKEFLTEVYNFVDFSVIKGLEDVTLEEFLYGDSEDEDLTAGLYGHVYKDDEDEDVHGIWPQVYTEGERGFTEDETKFLGVEANYNKWIAFVDLFESYISLNPDQNFWSSYLLPRVRFVNFIKGANVWGSWIDMEAYARIIVEIPEFYFGFDFDMNDTVTLPVLEKEGHTFKGWYDNKYFDGEPITEVESGTFGDLDLYAYFEINRYTITFDTNSVDEDDEKITFEVKVTYNRLLTEPTAPEKDGYIFGAWFTDEELTNEYDFSTPVKKDMTLYAAWVDEEDVITVSFVWEYEDKDAEVTSFLVDFYNWLVAEEKIDPEEMEFAEFSGHEKDGSGVDSKYIGEYIKYIGLSGDALGLGSEYIAGSVNYLRLQAPRATAPLTIDEGYFANTARYNPYWAQYMNFIHDETKAHTNRFWSESVGQYDMMRYITGINFTDQSYIKIDGGANYGLLEYSIDFLVHQFSDDVVLPDAPTYFGKVFVEWNTKADGTGDSITTIDIDELQEDIAIYAVFADAE